MTGTRSRSQTTNADEIVRIDASPEFLRTLGCSASAALWSCGLCVVFQIQCTWLNPTVTGYRKVTRTIISSGKPHQRLSPGSDGGDGVQRCILLFFSFALFCTCLQGFIPQVFSAICAFIKMYRTLALAHSLQTSPGQCMQRKRIITSLDCLRCREIDRIPGTVVQLGLGSP